MTKEIKKEARRGRHKRVRAKIFGTAGRPRLCVFKSAKHIYGQLIDDEEKKTLLAVSDEELKSKVKVKSKKLKEKKEKTEATPFKTRKVALAFEVGKLIAKKAKDVKIERIVFDRGGYQYHGRVKALAEGAREGGLKF